MKAICAAFIVLACLARQSLGAQRVDVKELLRDVIPRSRYVRELEPLTSFRFKRTASTLPKNQMDEAVALGPDTTLEVVKTTRTAQGTQLVKMQEKFKGHTVPDGIVTMETDTSGDQVIDASGAVYRNIGHDLDNVSASAVNTETALHLCLAHYADESLRQTINNVKVSPEILFDDDQTAYPAYLVQYLVQGMGKERRPTCIIDARDRRVIKAWNALDSYADCTATGTGGNLNTGKIRYGEAQKCLNIRRENGRCYLENEYVRVVNANFTKDSALNETASYNCIEADDEVNGAYSPLLDALFYGTVVGKMYEDWYSISAIEQVITLRVHYGVRVENAYWNGVECQFGDGGEEDFPFVILDIMSHEIAHGVTERNSDLYYFGPSGGLNEAFSDMAGEAAEAYLSQADWMTGLELSKLRQPLRYFDHPERDNSSISHVSKFTEGLDSHLSSGIFNRMFYVVIHQQGLPVKEAFGVFLHANRFYWHHMPSFRDAACDVMKAAYDLGQDGAKFRKAFLDVGIDACDVEDHVVGLRANKIYKDLKVSPQMSLTYLFAVPGEIAKFATVTATSGWGDVRIVVSNRTWGAIENEDQVHVYAEGFKSVQFVPVGTKFVTIQLSSESALSDVTLQATYQCVEHYEPKKENDIWEEAWSKVCSDKIIENNDGGNQKNDDIVTTYYVPPNNDFVTSHYVPPNNDFVTTYYVPPKDGVATPHNEPPNGDFETPHYMPPAYDMY